jgi:hypothetical protein
VLTAHLSIACNGCIAQNDGGSGKRVLKGGYCTYGVYNVEFGRVGVWGGVEMYELFICVVMGKVEWLGVFPVDVTWLIVMI